MTTDKVNNKEILVEREASISALTKDQQELPLIPDQKILDYYDEAIQCIKDDRAEAEDKYFAMAEMVINGGDPSGATKEAMVNLLKLRNEGVNQMIKVLDLWTRLKMKDRITSSQQYLYQQNNKYEVKHNQPNPHVKQLIRMAEQLDKENDDK